MADGEGEEGFGTKTVHTLKEKASDAVDQLATLGEAALVATAVAHVAPHLAPGAAAAVMAKSKGTTELS